MNGVWPTSHQWKKDIIGCLENRLWYFDLSSYWIADEEIDKCSYSMTFCECSFFQFGRSDLFMSVLALSSGTNSYGKWINEKMNEWINECFVSDLLLANWLTALLNHINQCIYSLNFIRFTFISCISMIVFWMLYSLASFFRSLPKGHDQRWGWEGRSISKSRIFDRITVTDSSTWVKVFPLTQTEQI